MTSPEAVHGNCIVVIKIVGFRLALNCITRINNRFVRMITFHYTVVDFAHGQGCMCHPAGWEMKLCKQIVLTASNKLPQQPLPWRKNGSKSTIDGPLE